MVLARLRLYSVLATLVSLAVLLALWVLGPTTVSAGRALATASQLSCGTTITADTTLDGDLVNCPSNGIVIGADGITLDLKGHTISGDGEPVRRCARDEPCDLGVFNDGHHGVTIRNGSVHGFDAGLVVANARRNLVARIASSRNRLFGLVLAEAARTVVRDGSWSRNPAPDGDGIGVFGSRHLRIENNSIRRNHSLGVHVEGSTHVSLTGNVFSRNVGPGIIMENGDRNEARRNRCVENAACIIVAPGNRNVIARNRSFRDGDGIAIEKGRDNLIIRNVVVRPRKTGIYLALQSPPIGGLNNVVRRNAVRVSGDDAFRVRELESHSVLDHNIASGAGDDGFDIRSRSTTLTGNRAFSNADLGIEAVRGVIGGSGNVARDNADPRQCTNVFCA
jgi:parallel beta-helix repeat protein